jgi:glycosyltransferase involved in cell wall biosynthesis
MENSKMKIGFVGYHFGDLTCFHGGAEIQREKTAQALQAHSNIEVVPIEKVEDLSEIDMVHFFQSHPYFADLARKLRQEKIPYVVSTVYYPPYPMKLVQASHRIMKRMPSIFKRVVYFGALNELWGGAEVLFPNTSAEAHMLKKFRANENIEIVWNGIDPERLKMDSDVLFFEQFPHLKGKSFILNVGRIEKRKNQRNLILACQKLRMPLVIVGKVGDQAYFKECQLVADESVTFTGPIYDDELLASAYKACTVFALPSIIETPGLSALEAAYFGKPIVITAHGGTRDYFQDAAVYLEALDENAIASAIAEQLKEPIVIEKRTLENYYWCNIVDPYIKWYKKILGGDRL